MRGMERIIERVKHFSIALVILLLLLVISLITYFTAKATTTVDITTYQDLVDFRDAINNSGNANHDNYRTADVILQSDITIPTTIFDWEPIGNIKTQSNNENSAKYYDYNFDGNDKKISFTGGDVNSSSFTRDYTSTSPKYYSGLGLFGMLGSSDPTPNEVKNLTVEIPTTKLTLDNATLDEKYVPNYFSGAFGYSSLVDFTNITVSYDVEFDFNATPTIKGDYIHVSPFINNIFSGKIDGLNITGNGIIYKNTNASSTSYISGAISLINGSDLIVKNITADLKKIDAEFYAGGVAGIIGISQASGKVEYIENKTNIKINKNVSYGYNPNYVGGVFGASYSTLQYSYITNSGIINCEKYISEEVRIGGVFAALNKTSGDIEITNVTNTANITVNIEWCSNQNTQDLFVGGILGISSGQNVSQMVLKTNMDNLINYGDINVKGKYYTSSSNPPDANGNVNNKSPAGIQAAGIVPQLLGLCDSISNFKNYGDVTAETIYDSTCQLGTTNASGIVTMIGYISNHCNFENFYNFGNITATANYSNSLNAAGICVQASINADLTSQGKPLTVPITFTRLFNMGDVKTVRTGSVTNNSRAAGFAVGLVKTLSYCIKIIDSGNIGDITGETVACGINYNFSVVNFIANSTTINTTEKRNFILNTYNQGKVSLNVNTLLTGKTYYLAGIAADAGGTNLDNCYNRGDLEFNVDSNITLDGTCSLLAGGVASYARIYLVATETTNNITNIYNRGDIRAEYNGTLGTIYAGGDIGYVYNYSKLTAAYNCGDIYITGSAVNAVRVGGVVGVVNTSNKSGTTDLAGSFTMNNCLSLGGNINTVQGTVTNYNVNRIIGVIFDNGANQGTNAFSDFYGLETVKNNDTAFTAGTSSDENGANISTADSLLAATYKSKGYDYDDGSNYNPAVDKWETDNIEANLVDYKFPYLKSLDTLIDTVSNGAIGIYVGKFQVNILTAPEEYEIIYDANGGTGSMANTLATKNAIVTLSAFAFTPPTSKTFLRWAENSNGTGNTYDDEQVFTYTLSHNLTLYAVYQDASIPTYKIFYEKNTGSGNMAETTVSQGDKITLRAVTFTKTNYVFKYWNTKADESGDTYQNEHVFDPYPFAANLTIYAIWSKSATYTPTPPAVVTTYKITYKYNGKTKVNTYNKGAKATIMSAVSKTGYTFKNWNTKEDNKGTTYNAGQIITVNKNLVLYAIWKKKSSGGSTTNDDSDTAIISNNDKKKPDKPSSSTSSKKSSSSPNVFVTSVKEAVKTPYPTLIIALIIFGLLFYIILFAKKKDGLQKRKEGYFVGSDFIVRY